ncbi:MAG TPA: hypothetical protein VFH15_01880 [Pyrinomonadaceae bacterium]|nr:hypothetical protein [Pyrinomonadaceae bacterium]
MLDTDERSGGNVALLILSIFWIYFSSGAEFLVKHPGVLNSDIRSLVLIKLLVGVMLLGGMAEIAMWSEDILCYVFPAETQA